MSDIKPSRIRCKKCGYEPNVITDVCFKCGGEIVKVCGSCGYENSVEKMYCDSCGSLLALTPEKKIEVSDRVSEKTKNDSSKIKERNLEFESIGETVSNREDSYRVKLNKEEIQNPSAQASLIDEKKLKDAVDTNKSSSDDTPSERINTNYAPQKKSKKKIYIIISSVVVICLLIFHLLFINNGFSKYKLIFTTKKYLTALKNEDYTRAYDYLSSNSKSLITLKDYLKTSNDYYSKIGKWDFKDIKIYYFDENQSIITYKLKEGNEDWKDDYLNFIKEYGVWRRPYVWNLFEQIDDAFSQRDFSTALFFSQKLYLIDPLDPRASGYLCWSEYFMRLYDKSAEDCKKVLDLSAIHPVKYYTEEELFWNKFNYADSLRFLGKTDESIKVYDSLISASGIQSESKCSVFLARSDAYVSLKDYDMAISDLSSASSVCKDNISKKEADDRMRIIEGLACDDAVKFVKNYNFNGIRFEDFLEQRLKKIISRNNNLRADLKFECEHKIGPKYQVRSFISGMYNRDILSYQGEVDLWEKTVQIRKIKEE
ncbi:MAG: hypothetical protein GX445_03625 [Elusimicrobia bacterium]|jgi:tetratricopeptide (TPR) repeat protein|nr:hypothetical protein [Elusimicrobiota bacterium]